MELMLHIQFFSQYIVNTLLLIIVIQEFQAWAW